MITATLDLCNISIFPDNLDTIYNCYRGGLSVSSISQINVYF